MVQHEKSSDCPGQFRLWKRRLWGNDGCPSGAFPVCHACHPLRKASPLQCRFPMDRSPLGGALFGAGCLLSPATSPAAPPASRGVGAEAATSACWAPGPVGGGYRAGCYCLRAVHGRLPHQAQLLLRLLKPCFSHSVACIEKGRWVVMGWGTDCWQGTAVASVVLFTEWFPAWTGCGPLVCSQAATVVWEPRQAGYSARRTRDTCYRLVLRLNLMFWMQAGSPSWQKMLPGIYNLSGQKQTDATQYQTCISFQYEEDFPYNERWCSCS